MTLSNLARTTARQLAEPPKPGSRSRIELDSYDHARSIGYTGTHQEWMALVAREPKAAVKPGPDRMPQAGDRVSVRSVYGGYPLAEVFTEGQLVTLLSFQPGYWQCRGDDGCEAFVVLSGIEPVTDQ